MHVFIEALGIDRLGGGRSATLNLLNALFEADRETRFTVFLSRSEWLASEHANVRAVIAGNQSAILARVWAQLVVPVYARRSGVDLIHHAKNLTVAFPPCPTVVTVYDLTILRHPQVYPQIDRLYWRHVQPLALNRATRVIAISRATAEDLTRYYSVPPGKISVIYPSCAPRFVESLVPDPTALRRRYGIDGEYLLHVGSISLKKNLSTLLRAYGEVRRRGFSHRLVLAGRFYQKGDDRGLVELLSNEGIAGGVILTGPVADEHLPSLYRGASALVFPSLHEGFGIVPLEAMASGTPVISSKGGALGEVVDGGGVLVDDPLDVQSFADAITHVISDAEYRARLVERGRARALAFSPETSARQTLEVYREMATRRSYASEHS